MPTVIPRIFTPDPEGLVTFLREVFDARGDFHDTRPTELLFGDSTVMISGTGERAAMAAFLYVYVPEVDPVFAKAVARGATSLEEPLLTPYGDRRAMVQDPWDNTWQIASHA